MTLYTQDDAETWADWTSKNPPPARVSPPYATVEERETALKYMARYYEAIQLAGGSISNIALMNPYVRTMVAGQLMTPEESQAYGGGSGGGVTIGPKPAIEPKQAVVATEQQAPATSTNPEAAKATGVTESVPASSWWRRFVRWVKNLFS